MSDEIQKFVSDTYDYEAHAKVINLSAFFSFCYDQINCWSQILTFSLSQQLKKFKKMPFGDKIRRFLVDYFL